MRTGAFLALLVYVFLSWFPRLSAPTPALLFISVRSAASHIELRDALRETWVGVGSMAGLEFLAAPQNAIQYRFFIDHYGCCAEEAAKYGDLEIIGGNWQPHPNFTASYNLSATADLSNIFHLGEGLLHYIRDYHVNIMLRSLQLADFRYNVQMDDDAVLCTQHLAFQLFFAPRPLRRFIFGFKRGTSYDNSFLLMSHDVVLFFRDHYYREMRGTHRLAGSLGATLGSAAGYRQVMERYNFNLVKRSGNIRGCPDGCIAKLEKVSASCQCVAASKKAFPDLDPGASDRHFRPTLVNESQCHEQRATRFPHAFQCSEAAVGGQGPERRKTCLSLYCLESKDHVCRGYPLVDHMPNGAAWTTRYNKPGSWHDNSQMCIHKIAFDKIKDPNVVRNWWNLVWPNNRSVTSCDGRDCQFRNLSTFLATPSKYPDRCVLKANRGYGLGRDVE